MASPGGVPPPVPGAPSNLDVLVAVVRVEGKVDALVTGHMDHESRIRALERGRWPLRAIVALASVAAVFSPIVGTHFTAR